MKSSTMIYFLKFFLSAKHFFVLIQRDVMELLLCHAMGIMSLSHVSALTDLLSRKRDF